jgi:diacylglycerol O-acyltransferase
MQQLTGLDTTFLNIETPTTYGHIASLAIFDPSTGATPATIDEVRALLEERIHLLAPYRRRLVEVPFGIDHPYWIEDPDFDLDFHLRHIGLPPPGDSTKLTELVERIVARPLDRRKPLWELYVIEGLENGYVAQLSKIHHSAIDGVGGAEIMASLLDISPEPRVVDPPEEPWKADDEPSELEMFGRGMLSVARSPARGVKLWVDTIRSVPAIAKSMGIDASGPFGSLGGSDKPDPMLSQAATKPPRTSFNEVIGPHRRFAYTSIPLAKVKKVKNAHDVTINDVILAMCATALRNYLAGRDELPHDPLIAMVPVSVRTEEQAGELGNQVASMTTSIHTDLEDPLVRLQAIHESMTIAKHTHNAIPATLQQDIAQFSPPAVAGRASRLITRAAARRIVDLPYNVVISNVPGPQFPLYGMGAELVANYPVSTITDGSGLNFTVQSYNGNLDFGIIGCRDLVPDISDFVGLLNDAIDELVKRSTTTKKSTKKKAAKK